MLFTLKEMCIKKLQVGFVIEFLIFERFTFYSDSSEAQALLFQNL